MIMMMIMMIVPVVMVTMIDFNAHLACNTVGTIISVNIFLNIHLLIIQYYLIVINNLTINILYN